MAMIASDCSMNRSALYHRPFATTQARHQRLRVFRVRCNRPASEAGHVTRKELLSAAALLFAQTCTGRTAAAAPLAPKVGACVECIGEVNGGLNACTLTSPSCVSTQNDDEAHFIPPWQYNGTTEEAVQALIATATGKGPITISTGDSRVSFRDAADYAFEELGASIKGEAPPAKPKGKSASERACFSGRLEERHTTADGSEYLHIVFGEGPNCRDLGVIDAEFIFLSGDSVVDIRTASREDPGIRGASLSLSLSYGVQYDRNVAKREMEELRKALRWEVVPVVTDFDPRFNQRRPLFFERLYQPFLKDKQEFEDIVDK